VSALKEISAHIAAQEPTPVLKVAVDGAAEDDRI
jgi:hypothetical protein